MSWRGYNEGLSVKIIKKFCQTGLEVELNRLSVKNYCNEVDQMTWVSCHGNPINLSHLKVKPLISFDTHIIVVPVPVWSLGEWHYLPEKDTITPHITCWAELPVLKSFRCGPAHWNFTSLKEMEAAQSFYGNLQISFEFDTSEIHFVKCRKTNCTMLNYRNRKFI